MVFWITDYNLSIWGNYPDNNPWVKVGRLQTFTRHPPGSILKIMTGNIMDAVFQHDPNIVSRQVAGEMILVPIKNNIGDMESIYTLNPTAARIWELIDGRRTIAEIYQQILLEFEVDPAQAGADMNEFVAALQSEGALVEV